MDGGMSAKLSCLQGDCSVGCSDDSVRQVSNQEALSISTPYAPLYTSKVVVGPAWKWKPREMR